MKNVGPRFTRPPGSSLAGQIAVLQRTHEGAPGLRPKGENWTTTCIFSVTDSD